MLSDFSACWPNATSFEHQILCPSIQISKINSDFLPVVELDTEAQASYVRFREGQVARD
jgi:hypothetical protein